MHARTFFMFVFSMFFCFFFCFFFFLFFFFVFVFFFVFCFVFFVNFLTKYSFRNTIRVSNVLDSNQDRFSVGPDLSPNLLQRLSADGKSRR